jgi:hypothetical protein
LEAAGATITSAPVHLDVHDVVQQAARHLGKGARQQHVPAKLRRLE